MPGELILSDRCAVVLEVWPELRGLPVTYILGHAALVEDVLADDPKAPVDAKTERTAAPAIAGRPPRWGWRNASLVERNFGCK